MRAVLVALVALGAACHGPSLRDRVEAAGVFSPVRVDVGNPHLVTLGQTLFFDPELSGNRNISCATCHLPANHSADRRVLGVGQDRARLTRQVPALFNRGGSDPFFWDGRLELGFGGIVGPVELPKGLGSILEAQALLPLLDRHEMRGFPGDVGADGRPNELAVLPDDATTAVWQGVMTRLVSYPGYRQLFADAYPDIAVADLTIVEVGRAIAAFEERLWELDDSPFDEWVGSIGKAPFDDALSPLAKRGLDLFFGDAGCSRCHNGPLLSDGKFHAIGVPQIGPGRNERHADLGRYAVTLDPHDQYAFRTPPLRNVALTAPYMHDGAYDRLEDAVRHHLEPQTALAFYDDSRLPADLRNAQHPELNAELLAAVDPLLRPARPLRDDEILAIVELLTSMSSRTEEVLPPNPAEPGSLPSGLPLAMPDSTDLVSNGF